MNLLQNIRRNISLTRARIFGAFFVLVALFTFGLLADGNYIVEEGDRLRDLAKDFRVTEEVIIAANALTEGDELTAGQELLIPSVYAPDVTSKLTFGFGVGVPSWEVGTRSVLMLVAIL